ncbi:peptidylprolyl isomerase [Blattabacterium cuenoti]|uniref:peptidylprolyl isomerase n=1 Tax=Blattabacterium cuenoti TaxID=1653831 RepID=UPI00163CD021|nr:peptidylprolyl isomerase [Blattabacterium cuenoti]
MIKKCLYYFFLFTTLIYSYFSYGLDKLGGIAAVVGNEIILNSEIKNYDCNAFNHFLIQKLMLDYAKKDNSIQISDQELQLRIQSFFSEMKKKYVDQEELITTQFKKKEFLQELNEIIKNQQYIEILHKKITDSVDVTPEEVRKFFLKNENKILFVPKQTCISYIVFYPKWSSLKKNKVLNFLKKIKKEIHTDEDFSTQAILLSEDNKTALHGGLMKGIKINDLPKEFKHVISSLKEEEISEPFETDLGFHLIKLEKKRKDAIDIKHILIKPKYTKYELEKTKLFAESIRKGIIKKRLCLENMSNHNNEKIFSYIVRNKICIEETHLSEKMKKILFFLKKGEISNPYKEIMNNKEVFVIVKLLDTVPSYPISFEKDYTRLKNFVINVKKEDEIKNWAKKILKKTYVKINCT